MPSEAAYSRASGQVRLRVLRFATDAFRGLGRWRSDDMEAFIAAVVPVVLAGEKQIATLTDLYLMDRLAEMYGIAPGAGIDLDAASGSVIRNGTPPETVYQRPFKEIWTALKRGESLTSAVNRGEERLRDLVATDMQLAKTHGARESLRKQGDTGYFRRTLGGGDNCALCVVASTQRYRTSELMPIHPGCGCGVDPAPSRSGHVLDKQLLDQVHREIGGSRDARTTQDYRKIIVTRNHGEYGPTLTLRDQHFTGPADI